MPSIEISKLQAVTGPKGLSGSDRAASGETGVARDIVPGAASRGNVGVSLEVDSSVSAAKPPVDVDRVAEIRQALRDGSYPLVPAKIADAIIAAQYSFEIKR